MTNPNPISPYDLLNAERELIRKEARQDTLEEVVAYLKSRADDIRGASPNSIRTSISAIINDEAEIISKWDSHGK